MGFNNKKTMHFFSASLLAVFVIAGFFNKHALAFKLEASQIITNDPGFTLNELNIDKQWGLVKANFPKAWEKTTGKKSTVIAVIDTGVDQNHEDLKTIDFVDGYDLINNHSLSYPTNSDDNGHGSLVAGVLAATANNGVGITGAVWDVLIMPVKALDKEGKGDSSTVSKAIIWAADNNADIINLSLGGVGFEQDADLAKAISYAFNKGALIVAASGNDSNANTKNLDQEPVFPVCNDNDQNMVIGVSAVDQNNLKPSFANYGKNCVDVVAPGKRILSSIGIDPITNRVAPSGYAYVSGTSFAAAFVSAQAALIKSLYPLATNTQIRDRIISTATQIDFLNLAGCGGHSCTGLLGAGLIDVSKSLEQNFPIPQVMEGDVVRAENDSKHYWIWGGQKRLISPFVFSQRFLNTPVKILSSDQLNNIQDGPFATPVEGTLIKTLNDPTVYIISSGLKLPITGQIFNHMGFSFSNVKVVDVVEAASWVRGKFLAPKEGTLVKPNNSNTLYWTIGGSLHPINWNFYLDRGLKVFPTIIVTSSDLMSYNIGESYIR